MAAQVAGAWSKSGVRLILADGCLADPKLHSEVGIENGEGIADALVFGTSVRRVAQRVEGYGYFAVAAGTVVADASDTMSGGRWAHLCSSFREAGVTLAVYLHAEDPATAIALQEASYVLVVAGQDEDPLPVVTECAAQVIGVLGVPGADIESLPESVADDEIPEAVDAVEEIAEDSDTVGEIDDAIDDSDAVDAIDDAIEYPEAVDAVEEIVEDSDTVGEIDNAIEDPEAVDALEDAFEYPEAVDADEETVEDSDAVHLSDSVDDVEDGYEGPLEAGTIDALAAADDSGDAEEAIFQRAMGHADQRDEDGGIAPLEEILEESEGSKGGGRRGLLLLVLPLVVAGALGAAWLGYLNIPGITPTGESAEPVPPAEVLVAAAPAVEQSPVQGYSVALAAYGDPAAAHGLIDRLTPLVPEVLFLVVPVEVGGRSYYRALAGPATDSADAASLLERVASGAGVDPSTWVLRRTPQAFELGEMPDLVAAERRVEVLRGLDVPAYVLAVDYTDGSTRYRVYAGAYADEAEAALLLLHLTDRDLNNAHLVDRKGRLPA